MGRYAPGGVVYRMALFYTLSNRQPRQPSPVRGIEGTIG